MTTSAQRDENRLTSSDRLAISHRVSVLGQATRRMNAAERVTTMERAACHEIGCSTYDLRASELDEIAEHVRAWIEHDRTAHPNQYRTP